MRISEGLICPCSELASPDVSCQLCTGTGTILWTRCPPDTEGEYWWRPDPRLLESGAVVLWGHSEDEIEPYRCLVFRDQSSQALMAKGGYFDYVPPYPLDDIGHTGYWALASDDEPPAWLSP
jgi:hypothetical protein